MQLLRGRLRCFLVPSCANSLNGPSRRCADHLVMSDHTMMVPFTSAEKASKLVAQFGASIQIGTDHSASDELTGIETVISSNSTRPPCHVRALTGPSAP